MNPTRENDLLREEIEHATRDDMAIIAAQAASEDEDAPPQRPELQVARETVDTASDESEYALSKAEREAEQAKMTRGRLVANLATNAVFILINLLGFVLTFIDYGGA